MGPAALIALLLTPAPSAGATFTADTIGGYSTQVLAQILQVWQEPMGARGTAVLELTIDPSGSLAGCAIRKNSVTPAADAALCAAAQNGWIDRKAVIMESLIGLKRAGSKMIITYFAAEALREGWIR